MFNKLRRFFLPIKISNQEGDWRGSFPELDVSNEQRNHWHNMEEAARADLRMHHEALQHNLDMMYRTFLVALLSFIVAAAALIVAINK